MCLSLTDNLVLSKLLSHELVLALAGRREVRIRLNRFSKCMVFLLLYSRCCPSISSSEALLIGYYEALAICLPTRPENAGKICVGLTWELSPRAALNLKVAAPSTPPPLTLIPTER